eukprot:jgi/Psemu1/50541/gm1.50541_g
MNDGFQYDADVQEPHPDKTYPFQEHNNNYFHNNHNQYNAPLTQEYDNNDGFCQDNETDCYHQDTPDQHEQNSRLIQTTSSTRPYLMLCDSCSKTTLFSHHALPNSITPPATTPISGVTMTGEFNSNQQILLQHLTLPELATSTSLPSLYAWVVTIRAIELMRLGTTLRIIKKRAIICIQWYTDTRQAHDSHHNSLYEYP